MNYRIYDIAFSVSSAIGTEALGSCWLRRNDATCTCWCSCDVCLPLDLQRGIRGMPSCLYFSVDIEKWGILLEADSSHPLAFDVEKKTHTKTKQNLTRQMLFLGHEIVFAYILCTLLFRGYCNFSRRSWKKNIIGCFLNVQCHDTSFLWILTNGYWLCSINYTCIIKDGSFV